MSTHAPIVLPRLLGRAALLTALITVAFGYGTIIFGSETSVGYDYAIATRPAAEHVWNAESPYPAPSDVLAGDQHTYYIYPPPLAFLAVPTLALDPLTASRFVAVLGLLLVIGSLLVLGVRDPWCHLAILAWAPTANGVQNVNVSLLLTFLVALGWRWRAHTGRGAFVLGAAVALKLFLAPLLLWPLASRRPRVTIAALTFSIVIVGATWAVLGLKGLAAYPELLRRVDERWSEASYSTLGVLHAAGIGSEVGRAVAMIMGGAIVIAAVRFARRGDELSSFTLFVAAALVATPIVWQHYLLLLAVPLAISRPTISIAWLLPILLWLAPMSDDNGVLPQTLLVPCVGICLVAAVLLRNPATVGLSGRLARPWSGRAPRTAEATE